MDSTTVGVDLTAMSPTALSGSATDLSELEPAACRSRPRVLHLFSGPKERSDGLAAFLESQAYIPASWTRRMSVCG